MVDSTNTRILPLDESSVPAVIEIHRAGLGYTVNSQLGYDHLRFLYRAMAGDPNSYVGVATQNGAVVGVVSGTLDEQLLKSQILRMLSTAGLGTLALRMLAKPVRLVRLTQGLIVARPIYREGIQVRATLTAIAVDSAYQGRGVGRKLVDAVEGYFREQGVAAYRLDTLIENLSAIEFYQDLGFEEVVRRAGSVVFVKVIKP